MPAPSETQQLLRQLVNKQKRFDAEIENLCRQWQGLAALMRNQTKSTSEEIDAIQGRRIGYPLVGRVSFTASQEGQRGNPISMVVSQDGPFVQTAWPMAIWKPNAPSNATNAGRWSPVYSWPLPLQQSVNTDTIDISWEIVDSGSQRNFQNEAVPPLFSRPDLILELPKPTLFAPSSIVQFIPTYEAINFSALGEGEVDTTGGELVVVLPGYRIVNM